MQMCQCVSILTSILINNRLEVQLQCQLYYDAKELSQVVSTYQLEFTLFFFGSKHKIDIDFDILKANTDHPNHTLV